MQRVPPRDEHAIGLELELRGGEQRVLGATRVAVDAAAKGDVSKGREGEDDDEPEEEE